MIFRFLFISSACCTLTIPMYACSQPTASIDPVTSNYLVNLDRQLLLASFHKWLRINDSSSFIQCQLSNCIFPDYSMQFHANLLHKIQKITQFQLENDSLLFTAKFEKTNSSVHRKSDLINILGKQE